MKLTFDPSANAAYLHIHTGAVYATIELKDSVYLDVDSNGLVLGVEFLNARNLSRSFLSKTEFLRFRSALISTTWRDGFIDRALPGGFVYRCSSRVVVL